MAIKSHLADSKGRHIASHEFEHENRLHVATSPRFAYNFAQPALLRTDNGQAEMNVNGFASGAALNVWDGTGVGDVGAADWIPSGVGSESAAAVHSGTNGWDTGNTQDGDKTEFLGPITALGTYGLLNFWLNPQIAPAGSTVELGWRDANGGVGNKVNAENYVAMTIGVWQLVSIPLADFGAIGSVTKLRVKYKNTNQRHYIDDISLVASGGTGPFIYRMSRLNMPALDIHRLSLAVAGQSSGWAVNDFATINGGLGAGLLLKFWDYATGEVFWSFNLKNNLEMFGRTGNVNSITFAGTQHLVLLDYDLSEAKARIESTRVFDIVVRDDLSSLLGLNAFATGGELKENDHGF